jgi:excisionase family DNA binding protein
VPESSLAADPHVGPALLLTVEETGRLIGQSRSGVYRLVRAGRLQLVHPSPNTARIPRSSVEALVEALIASPQDEGLAGQTSPSSKPAGLGRNACQG